MVQIGNFHIGKGETAKTPVVDSGEAFLLWDLLVSRYGVIEQTQIFLNFAHDPDFKILIRRALNQTLRKQVEELENEMNRYKLALPNRPPKSVSLPATTGLLEDQFIFKLIFSGIQNFLDLHIRGVRSTVSNDALRDIFIRFTEEELDVFNSLVKFGKLKGWLQVPPAGQ